MKGNDLSDEDMAIWKRLSDAHKNLALSERMFLTRATNRVALIRYALSIGDKATAFYIAPQLEASELTALFDVWVEWAAFSHGAIQVVRDIILSLPRPWVLENIERVAEPILQVGGDEEYRRLLELYSELDVNLALKLAQRAVASPDPDIRESGEETIKKIDGQ